MTDLIFKILGLLKELVSKKKESNKIIFENFLDPTMKDLNFIHENYITTFLKYIKTIQTSECEFITSHPVFEEITTDSILTSQLREKFYSFYDNTNSDEFDNFLKSVGEYLEFLTDTFDDGRRIDDKSIFMASNVIRYHLYFSLEFLSLRKSLADSERKEKAINSIQNSIKNLQVRYRAVLDQYNQLKKALLQ